MPKERKPGKRAPVRRPRTRGRAAPAPLPPEPLPAFELTGLLDDVKATVIALLASLQEKERGLRVRMRTEATPGVKTGLSDIRLLRRWADRTLGTIETLERGREDGLRPLLEELGEFSDILHAHDAEQATLAGDRV